MYFLDLKKREIVELNENWSTQRYIVNCGDILDMPVDKAYSTIERVLSISFVNRTVLINFIVENCENIDDFEIICDLLISAWFYRNEKEELREEKEIRLAAPKELVERLNCDYMNLKSSIDHEFHNRYFNITIQTRNADFKYEFINPPKEK